MHYTAAHHYSPSRAASTEFDEFWDTSPLDGFQNFGEVEIAPGGVR